MRRVLVPPVMAPVPPGRLAGLGLRSLTGQTMGTSWSVKLALSEPVRIAAVRERIEQRLSVVVEQMSGWLPHSDLSRFNRAPAGRWVPLPAEFFMVLDHAVTLAEETAGAFDPALGDLVALWGFGPEPAPCLPPPQEAVTAALARSGWRRLDLDRRHRRVRKSAALSLGLSGIAKGFAVDLVCDGLRELGVPGFLVEIGGELRGEGVKPDGLPWWVALEPPPPAAAGPHGAEAADIVALHHLAIATSGDYRRFFERAGGRYCHMIDPWTGHPMKDGPAAVTVLHATCMHADALATALSVLGVREGMEYARHHRVAARFVTRGDGGLEEHMTPAFAAMLE